MVLPTKAVLDYLVNPYGDTAAHLASYIDASVIPVPATIPVDFGVTILDDTSQVVGAQARRRIDVSILQPPLQIGNRNSPKASQGNGKAACQVGVVSTSPQDTLGGAGLQVITLHYLDVNGNPQTQDVSLAGKKMSLSAAVNINTILASTVFKTAGAHLSSLGVIYLYFLFSSPLEKGRAPYIVASFGESYVTKFGNVNAKPLQFLMTNALQRAVGPVVTVAPVLTV